MSNHTSSPVDVHFKLLTNRLLCSLPGKSTLSRHAWSRAQGKNLREFGANYIPTQSYLVLCPVVEEKVDADEEEEGNDKGLRVLESERLR